MCKNVFNLFVTVSYFSTMFLASVDSGSSSFSLKLLTFDKFSRILYAFTWASARLSFETRVFWSGRVTHCANTHHSRWRAPLWMGDERTLVVCAFRGHRRTTLSENITAPCRADSELNTRVTQSDETQTVFS